MNYKKQTVVILGAGFAGLRTALLLEKSSWGGCLRRMQSAKNTEIILIDEHDCHIYTPDLYEIATAYNKHITPECLTKLKDTVAIPMTKILHNTNVSFVRGKVNGIDSVGRKIHTINHSDIAFDYLVLTLGSVVNYYNIPGLEEYAFPLKTVSHALAINCHIDQLFQKLWQNKKHKKISIVVGGGGATGVELAAELPAWVKMICKKYEYPQSLVEIHLIEGGTQLAGQSEKGTALVRNRLNQLGIKVHMQTLIKNVTEVAVRVETSDKSSSMIPMDVLLWTGGVKPNPLIQESFPFAAPNGSLPVNEFLQYSKGSQKYSRIYAAGDNACIINTQTGKPVPGLAQAAFDQGKIIANNIAADIIAHSEKAQPSSKNWMPTYKSYVPKLKGIITPLGGKYAVFSNGKTVIEGFWMWVLRRFVDLRYATSILPFFYAIRKWLHDTNVFVQND